MSYLVLDTETTGIPITKGFNKYYAPSEIKYYNCSRLIELAYIIYDKDDNIIKEFSSLVKPDNFQITNSHIHGISQEDALTNGKLLIDVMNEFNTDLDSVDILVAHNMLFDNNILLSESYRMNNLELVNKINSKRKDCTMLIGQQVMRLYKFPKLVELYRFLYNKPVTQIHRALSDVIICADCYKKIKKF
jgi:DNA polymerase III epsilon subunit-like protein